MSADSQVPDGVEVFFSYAHADEKLRDSLMIHLTVLKKLGLIKEWSDRKIGPGIEWKKEIDERLNAAHIILLLVSPEFLASNYCYDVEAKRAIERHEAGEARVIPVILRPAMWRESPLGHLQALPEDAKPVTKWESRDDALLNVAEGVKAAVEQLRLSGKLSTAKPLAAALASTTVKPVPAAKKIFISYKRDAEPDGELLGILEKRLGENGHQLFTHRHLEIGAEWFEEIERQICTADAVVVLLSSKAVSSEMVIYEVQTAHRASKQNGGVPRLIPVRLMYDKPLEDPLAGILDSAQYLPWGGKQDNERLMSELLVSLRAPVSIAPGSAGGGIPLGAKHYIVRHADEEFENLIARWEAIVLVEGARQVGKTSLLARGLERARQSEARVVVTDLQMLTESDLESAHTFYLALARMIAEQLELDPPRSEMWDARQSGNTIFDKFMRNVLGRIEGRLVWGVDEADRLFTRNYGSDVFSLFRVWRNQRTLNPASPWPRLTLAVAYATEPHLFITDPNMSPFNVGKKVKLSDFTIDQVAALNGRYDPAPLNGDEDLQSYYHLLNGHPYLVHSGLEEMSAHGLSLEEFVTDADGDSGPFSDHLRRILVLLERVPALRNVLCDMLRGKPSLTEESFYRLRSAGIISGVNRQQARPRCNLYETYLRRHLLSE
jgi:hypothetical protein